MPLVVRTNRDLIRLGQSLGIQITVTNFGKGHYRLRKWIDGKVISTGEAIGLQTACDLAQQMFNAKPWNTERESLEPRRQWRGHK